MGDQFNKKSEFINKRKYQTNERFNLEECVINKIASEKNKTSSITEPSNSMIKLDDIQSIAGEIIINDSQKTIKRDNQSICGNDKQIRKKIKLQVADGSEESIDDDNNDYKDDENKDHEKIDPGDDADDDNDDDDNDNYEDDKNKDHEKIDPGDDANDDNHDDNDDNDKSEVKINFCTTCQKSFSTGGNFKKHLKMIHHATRKHLCGSCDAEFTLLTELQEHKQEIHKQKKIICNQCNKQFSSRNGLNYHLLTHTGIKLFHCPECTYQTHKKHDLAKHAVTHSKAKAFKCDFQDCEKAYGTNSSLRYHQAVKNHLSAPSLNILNIQDMVDEDDEDVDDPEPINELGQN